MILLIYEGVIAVALFAIRNPASDRAKDPSAKLACRDSMEVSAAVFNAARRTAGDCSRRGLYPSRTSETVKLAITKRSCEADSFAESISLREMGIASRNDNVVLATPLTTAASASLIAFCEFVSAWTFARDRLFPRLKLVITVTTCSGDGVGAMLGTGDGNIVGGTVGIEECLEFFEVGVAEGVLVGIAVGVCDGTAEGITEGANECKAVGVREGTVVGTGVM